MSTRFDENDILDAVRECIMAVGFRRTTLADVARRVGASRMTLYRRYPDVDALTRALVEREFGRLMSDTFESVGDAPSIRERLAKVLARGVEAISRNDLYIRILDVDPELILPYVVDRLGTFQQLVISTLKEQIAEGQEEGSIRQGNPEEMARTIELLARSFVLAARASDQRIDQLLDEFELMVDRYLAP
jgi:AcrR family transcriptional regulator